jgi:hypothetical protein
MLFISGSFKKGYNKNNPKQKEAKMKKSLIFTAILFSASLSAENTIQDNSITVHNSSDITKQVWITGESHKIEIGSSLRVPCYAGESIYVQSEKTTNVLSCGEKKVINNEY